MHGLPVISKLFAHPGEGASRTKAILQDIFNIRPTR